MSESLHYKTASELSLMLADKSLSAVELTKDVLSRIHKVDEKIKAVTHLDEEDALGQAKASDERRAVGEELGALDGIPIGIKDILAVKGQPLTCGSKILENFVSPYDATSIAKLKRSGGILLCRLNMDEFAMGSSTENSSYFVTSNPWDLQCIPGGSSGGSAAAVASGEAILTLGTDTGGSIRQPASLCGVVGMKPTYGLVSRYGLVAFASSLDQIGPLGRSVEDVALLLHSIAGYDKKDSTSFKLEVPEYRPELHEKKGPWKLGIPKEYFGEGLDAEVRAAVDRAIDYYRSIGCKIQEVSLPHTEYAVATYYILATAEASSNLARFDGVRYGRRSEKATSHVDVYSKSRAEGFGEEVKRRVILGTYVLSSGYYDAYYLRAQKVRTLIRNDFLKVYEEVDALLTPTAPTVAFKKGERASDPLAMYLSDIFTISTNLAGVPAISVPCGSSSSGLPIGLQVIGKPFQESDLLAIAHSFEQAHDFSKVHPSL